MKKSNNSKAIKVCANLLNKRLKKIVHDKIQWLNCGMHYLNMKIK